MSYPDTMADFIEGPEIRRQVEAAREHAAQRGAPETAD